MPPGVDWLELVRNGVPSLLCIVAGAGMGFFCARTWLGSVDPKFRRYGAGNLIFSLLTVTGPLVLMRWKQAPDAVAGVFWVASCLLGFGISYMRARNALVNSLGKNGAHRETVAEFVRAHLLSDGLRETEARAEKKLQELKAADDEAMKDSRRIAIAQLHDFVHTARDVAVQGFADFQDDVKKMFSTGEAVPMKKFHDFLHRILDQYLNVLSALTRDPQGLWVAVRVATKIDGQLRFATTHRAGSVDQAARNNNTEPVAADKGLPKRLADSLLNDADKATRGVLFIEPKSKRNREMWCRVKNDSFKADEYVMAAPITIRRVGSDGKTACEMVAILFANHTRHVFYPWMTDVARCCVDAISMVLSLAIAVANKEMEQATQSVKIAAPTSAAASKAS